MGEGIATQMDAFQPVPETKNAIGAIKYIKE